MVHIGRDGVIRRCGVCWRACSLPYVFSTVEGALAYLSGVGVKLEVDFGDLFGEILVLDRLV